ncbi:g4335 [Coccomyxa elongata]
MRHAILDLCAAGKVADYMLVRFRDLPLQPALASAVALLAFLDQVFFMRHTKNKPPEPCGRATISSVMRGAGVMSTLWAARRRRAAVLRKVHEASYSNRTWVPKLAMAKVAGHRDGFVQLYRAGIWCSIEQDAAFKGLFDRITPVSDAQLAEAEAFMEGNAGSGQACEVPGASAAPSGGWTAAAVCYGEPLKAGVPSLKGIMVQQALKDAKRILSEWGSQHRANRAKLMGEKCGGKKRFKALVEDEAPTPVTDHLGHVRPAVQQPCPSSSEEGALQAVEEGWVAWPPSSSSPFSLPTLCSTVLEQKKKGSLAFQREMNPSQKAEDLRSNLRALSAGRAACWSSGYRMDTVPASPISMISWPC